MRVCSRLWLLALVVLINACGSVTMNMANTRFLSPETSGRFRFDTGMQGVTPVTIVQDASASPPATHSPQFGDANSSTDFFLGGGFGLSKGLELYINWDVGGPPVFGLKLQLLGAPHSDAKAGNFSLALTGGGGYISQGSSDPGGSWSYSRQLSSADASVILGYRAFPTLLIYGGPFLTSYHSWGKIYQPADTGTQYPYSGQGLQKGINAGVELAPGGIFFGRFHMRVEGAFVQSQFESLYRESFSAGLAGGFQF